MRTTKKTTSLFLLISIIATLFFLNACTAVPEDDLMNLYELVGVPPTDLNRVLYVKNSPATTSGDGLSWATAYGSGQLQTAINTAHAAYKSGGYSWYVVIQQGTYIPSSRPNSGSSNHFSMQNGVTIIGGYKGDEIDGMPVGTVATTLSGNNTYRVFYHPSNMPTNLNVSAVLRNVTISNGNSTDKGGGMYSYHNSPVITHCTFTNNKAEEGGGMCCQNSDSILISCTFTKNEAVIGGGLYSYNSSPKIINCAFIENKATRTSDKYGGGGMLSNSSNPEITNCTFFENIATRDGGGLYHRGGTATITNCTFTANKANSGAGGGMYRNSGTINVNGSIVLGNTASNTANKNAYGVDSKYFIINNSLFTNTPANENLSEVFELDGGSIKSTTLNGTTYIQIKSGGKAHNKISENEMRKWYDTDLSTVIDQRGYPRFHGTGGDIGAIELQ